jgi:hypothetical protein
MVLPVIVTLPEAEFEIPINPVAAVVDAMVPIAIEFAVVVLPIVLLEILKIPVPDD